MSNLKILRTSSNLLAPSFRLFSSTQVPPTDSEKIEKVPETKSILQLDNAVAHCTAEVKKFDFYTYINGQYMPKKTQSHFYGIHALFLETLKSREISREASIC